MAERRITRRKDGRYMVRWQTDAGRKTKYFQTRAEARRFAAQVDRLKEEIHTNKTLATWAEECMEAYGKNLSIDTVIGYKSIIRNHISSHKIGKAVLSDLRPYQIQAWVDEMGGLSPKTVHNVYGCLHWILAKAVQNSIISSNPTTGCVLPQRVKPQRHVLTPGQAEAILDAMEGRPDYSLWLFIASTGCRLSEALGLAVADIDLHTGKYTIRQTATVSPTEHTGIIQQRTKSNNAQRTGYAPKSILRHILATQKTNLEHRLIAGSMWQDNGLVWCDDLGRPIKRNVVLGRLRRVQKSMGIPPSQVVGSHAFRHLVATALLKSNVSEAAIARQLGHYSAAYTRAQYMDAYDEEQQQIANITEGIINRQ